MPKYVVSSTIERPRWTTSTNSTVLKGDVVAEVTKLKQEIDGEIVVFASTQLVHTLIEHDLVDQLRLMVYPVVPGPASASSKRSATRSGCASSAPGPSATISRH
jgi:dihydrofolate reductase